MDILRFITAGSVDDGKSTLIGRLLYDTNNIKSDVLQSVTGNADEASSINLAFITDGLRAEREQGITIDVAYKYFTTKDRKYIITDAPGHSQYTRNLVTGASGVDAMIILIDAQNGITAQTRRHSLVAAFLKINHIVVAVNKMDLVGFEEQVFERIKNEYLGIAEKLELKEITFIPVSALPGDNISFPSQVMNWYKGKTLIQYLEDCEPGKVKTDVMRFSVQYVVDNGEKGYAGRLLSGTLKTGDDVVIYPEGKTNVVRKIIHGYEDVRESGAGQNVCVYLDGATMTRGDMLTHKMNVPVRSNKFEATVCWLDAARAMQTGTDYFLRINTKEVVCRITRVRYKIDAGTFHQYNDNILLEVNGFARVVIETEGNIAYDAYTVLPENARGIIIDANTNYTCGAFIISP